MQVVVVPPCLALSLRPTVGRFLHCQICLDSLAVTDLSISEYLKFKERLSSAPPSMEAGCPARNVMSLQWTRATFLCVLLSQTTVAYQIMTNTLQISLIPCQVLLCLRCMC